MVHQYINTSSRSARYIGRLIRLAQSDLELVSKKFSGLNLCVVSPVKCFISLSCSTKTSTTILSWYPEGSEAMKLM